MGHETAQPVSEETGGDEPTRILHLPRHSSNFCTSAARNHKMAKAPVIVITGTPGTGKTTHAQMLAEDSPVPLKHINVGDLIKEKGLYEEYDEEWQSYTVDEDKVSTTVPLYWYHLISRSFSTSSSRLLLQAV